MDVTPNSFFDELNLFRDLDQDCHNLLRPMFVSFSAAAGDVIFNQGDPAEFLYILLEGEVAVRFKPDDGPDLTVARVHPEGVVGWSAALGSPMYTSAALCVTNCRMVRVSSTDLRLLCERYPNVAPCVLERLAAVIAERLRNTHEYVIALLEQGLQISIHHA